MLSQVWGLIRNWSVQRPRPGSTRPHPRAPSPGERRTNTGKTLPMADLAQDSWEDINGDNTVNTSPEAERWSKEKTKPNPVNWKPWWTPSLNGPDWNAPPFSSWWPTSNIPLYPPFPNPLLCFKMLATELLESDWGGLHRIWSRTQVPGEYILEEY